MDLAENRFRMILNYELRSARRCRRFVSLLSFGMGSAPAAVGETRQPSSDESAGQASDAELEELLKPTVRDSDELAVFNGNGFILMGETDGSGVQIAVQRFRDYLADKNVEVRFAIATYPYDGRSEEELLDVVQRRYEISKGMAPGIAVAVG